MNSALIGFSPLKKAGWGDFRCCHTIADLRLKLAPCGQSRSTPSYTCGTACGENQSWVCSSIGKNRSQTTSLNFAGGKTRRRTRWRSALGARPIKYDAQRSRDLEQQGLKVLRFDHRQVLLQNR